MTKLSLVSLGGKSFYVPGRVNVGVYGDVNETVLIDTGMDRSSGKSLKKLMDAEGRTLKYIANTHSHADHIGGNRYLKENTSCSVAVPEVERPFVENTLLEPAFVWGASPFSTLQNKFLMAPPCKVDVVLPQSGLWEATGLELLCLSGHSAGMVGYRTPEDVVYIGDSVFSPRMVERHGLLFLVDLADWLVTLDLLDSLEARFYVPAHADPVEDISDLVAVTRKHLLDMSDCIWTFCQEPKTRDDLLASLMVWLGKPMDPVRYVLNLGALSAHLTYLVDRGEIEPISDGGRLLWAQSK